MIEVKESSKEEISFIEIIKSIVYSFIGIVFFFIPIKINNIRATTLFHIVYKIQDNNRGFLIICFITFTLIAIIRNIYFVNKEKDDIKKIRIYLKLISIVILIIIFYRQNNILKISDNTSLMIEELILNALTIFPISSVFLTLILDYGVLEIIEAYSHKTMKKMFNISGKNLLNIVIFIATDIFTGLFMINQLYKKGKLKEKELFIMAMYFPVSSILIIKYIASDLDIPRPTLYFLGILILILCNFIMVRIYPANKKKNSYIQKTNYKEHNYKKENRLIKAIERNLRSRGNKSVLKRMIESLEDCINLEMELIPNLVVVLYCSFFIMEKISLIDFYNIIFEPILELFKYSNYVEITRYFSIGVINNLMAIDNISSTVLKNNVIIGLIGIIGCISISNNYIFIKSANMPIKNIEYIVAYIERIIIILALYSIIFHLYKGYISI